MMVYQWKMLEYFSQLKGAFKKKVKKRNNIVLLSALSYKCFSADLLKNIYSGKGKKSPCHRESCVSFVTSKIIQYIVIKLKSL